MPERTNPLEHEVGLDEGRGCVQKRSALRVILGEQNASS